MHVVAAEPLDAVSGRLSAAGLALVTHSNRWPNHLLAMPNKLFHASSLGVPMVATDVGELARTVRQYAIGTLYRPGDARSLSYAIAEAIKQYPQLRDAAGRSRPDLSWQRDRAVLLDTYAELTSHPQPRRAPDPARS